MAFATIEFRVVVDDEEVECRGDCEICDEVTQVKAVEFEGFKFGTFTIYVCTPCRDKLWQ